MIKKKKKKIIFFSDRFFFVFVFVDIHFSSYISSKMLFFVSVRNPLCLIESSCKSKEVDVHFAFELKMNSILIKKKTIFQDVRYVNVKGELGRKIHFHDWKNIISFHQSKEKVSKAKMCSECTLPHAK